MATHPTIAQLIRYLPTHNFLENEAAAICKLAVVHLVERIDAEIPPGIFFNHIVTFFHPDGRLEIPPEVAESQKVNAYHTAPEAYATCAFDRPSEVFSVGILLYVLLTGNVPAQLHGKTMPQIKQFYCVDNTHPQPFPFSKTWSQNASHFLSVCLAQNPADRWTAGELLLHPFIVFLGTGSDGQGIVKPTPKEVAKACKKYSAIDALKIITDDLYSRAGIIH